MAKKYYSENEIKQLKQNPNIVDVKKNQITYLPEFKVRAVKDNLEGKAPSLIFLENGFDLEILGKDIPRKRLYTWREVYDKSGELGLLTDFRGKKESKKDSKELSIEEQLKKAEAKIKFLEMENGVFKKARRVGKDGDEKETKLTPGERYQLIHDTIQRNNLKRVRTYLCVLAGVSRSGYYAWMDAKELRDSREKEDENDTELIAYIFNQKSQKTGVLLIKMIMENDYCICMNHKKIRRLMRKYNLMTKVRRANPYKKMIKATQEHRTLPNLVNRQFDQGKPSKVLLTDITYLYYGNGQKAYLSCVKDGCTKAIIAHYLSTNLEMSIVYKTLEHLDQNNGIIKQNTILHSDQGVHYTNPEFQKKAKELKLTQSMSRKGNCWDNAPMESFFGHFKDEVEYKHCTNFYELQQVVDSYIDEYNNRRYQWGLEKMTPVQYRNHLLAA
ncbi:IS3 family transposase [Ornithinibacillus californiensis]|uniref:IS3 family transposase n=1 Tax=Ornithinibacillus californiensis TaxID=161536 RepID=UPI0012EDB80C|nr:IS3 family transposase [Ornithinibacillus californiensis]